MTFEPGQELSTTIIAISGESVFLDLNAKSEGILPVSEILDKEGNLLFKEGDTVRVYFTGSRNGEMIFTRRIGRENTDAAILENAFRKGIPVEGSVAGEIKGGFEVSVGPARAFCPYSQMGFREKKEPSEYVGRTLTFRIMEYRDNGKSLMVSNRAILQEEHDSRIKELSRKLPEGTRVECTVESLHEYGAFVDIGGFRALLPVSEVSREKVDDISTVLSPGDKLEVEIIRADWQRERVSVSRKNLLADPWDRAEKDYPEGKKLTGAVSRIADFGLFINLEPGLDGLVHISELEDVDEGTNLRKVFSIGEKMSVTVKSVDGKNRRISLKPASTPEQDKDAEKYMSSQNSEETYNPFAALFSKKK